MADNMSMTREENQHDCIERTLEVMKARTDTETKPLPDSMKPMNLYIDSSYHRNTVG